MKLKEKKLFNPDGDDSVVKLVGGNTTNILNLASINKQVYLNLFKVAYSNNWIPEKVSNMDRDKYQYEHILDSKLKEAFDTELSALIYMDSIQTNNLPNIANFITSPEIVMVLSRMVYDEALHSYSYGYTLANVMDSETFNNIVYKWRDNEILLNRNKFIVKQYELHRKNTDSLKSFLILLISNYLLEGVYFYNGFMFFHTLAYNGLMTATNTQINYIKRDELVHCTIFKNIINQFRDENKEDFDEDLIYELFKEAVKSEIEFSNKTTLDCILGITEKTIQDYTYYIANKRLKDIGLLEIFPKTENPYKHLDKIAAIDNESSNKSNSFEVTSISYKQPELFKGWDKFKLYKEGKSDVT